MDRLAALEVFVAVADRKSLVGAARQLRMSAPAVTRALAGLEAHLGTRLLTRTTRTVALTEAGARFLVHARDVLARLAAAEEEAAGDHDAPRGRLAVTASVTFGRMHVAPLLLEFLRETPAVTAQLLLVDRVVNLVEESIDVAFRIAELPDSSLFARRIGEVRRLLVASPDYLARRGRPRTPFDLAAHDLIAFNPRTAVASIRLGEDESWRASVRPRLEVNDAATAVASALAGDGITVAFSYVIAEELRAGTLEILLEPYLPSPIPVHVVTVESRLQPARVRSFLKFAAPRLARTLSPPATPPPPR